MKHMKTLLASAVAASTIAAAPVAMAEVGASVAVASTYLWRGFDLGSGTPAVSGDLSYSAGGAYGGVWASSGDTSFGSEFDLFVGYGMEFDGGFSFDISAWNYNYASSDVTFAELTDVVVSVGFGPIAITYYDNVAGGISGQAYYTLSASFGAFSATLGQHNSEALEAINGANVEDEEPIHLDISYAFNDNLSFTVSQFIEDEDNVEEDTKVVVSYSIPL